MFRKARWRCRGEARARCRAYRNAEVKPVREKLFPVAVQHKGVVKIHKCHALCVLRTAVNRVAITFSSSFVRRAAAVRPLPSYRFRSQIFGGLGILEDRGIGPILPNAFVHGWRRHEQHVLHKSWYGGEAASMEAQLPKGPTYWGLNAPDALIVSYRSPVLGRLNDDAQILDVFFERHVLIF